jgi:NADPH:quinone reductase-like Zn-dependent oxidoreductase
MRYYKFSAAERKLVMAEGERPEPGPGQIRVRVAAASLNYRDVYMVSRFGDVGIDNRIPLSDASAEPLAASRLNANIVGIQTGSREYSKT